MKIRIRSFTRMALRTALLGFVVAIPTAVCVAQGDDAKEAAEAEVDDRFTIDSEASPDELFKRMAELQRIRPKSLAEARVSPSGLKATLQTQSP